MKKLLIILFVFSKAYGQSLPMPGNIYAGTTAPPPPSWTNVVYDNIYLSSVIESPSTEWIANNTNGWFHLAMRNTQIAGANQGVRYTIQTVSSSAGSSQIGITFTSSISSEAGYPLSLYIAPSGSLYVNQSGSLTSVSYTYSTNEYICLYRAPSSSTWKVQSSPDKVTWTDRHTLSATGNGAVWAQVALYDNGSSITDSRIYHPQFIIVE